MVHTLPSPYIACGNVGGEQGVGGSHEEDVTGQLLNDADGATGSGGSGGSGSGSGETEDSSLVRFAAWKKGFMYLRHRSDGRPSAKMAMLLHPCTCCRVQWSRPVALRARNPSNRPEASWARQVFGPRDVERIDTGMRGQMRCGL